jgi:hypothetical protein
MGRAEARWRPREVGEVVAVLEPQGIDLRGSDASESTDGAEPPCDVNGEPAITSGSAGGIHGAAARRRQEDDGGRWMAGGRARGREGGARESDGEITSGIGSQKVPSEGSALASQIQRLLDQRIFSNYTYPHSTEMLLGAGKNICERISHA